MIVSCSLCCAFNMSFDIGDDSGGGAIHSPASAPPPVIAPAPAPASAPSFSYRVVSSIYFVMVSMYTIGYGDVTPITAATKVMVLLIDLLSFSFISVLMNQVIDNIIHRLETSIKNLDNDRRTTVAVLIVLSDILVGYRWIQYFYKEINRLYSIYLILITLTSI